MSTVTYNNAMGNLWNYLQGLSLSATDRKWLVDRLIESMETENITPRKPVFPHIGEDFKISPEVLAMSCGPLPEGFDAEKEIDNMWEEMAG